MYGQGNYNPPPGHNPGRPTPFPPLPPPPPTTMPTTAQSYAHSSHMYPPSQHNPKHESQNVHQNSQQFPSPSPSPSLGQPHLPPSSVFPRPPVTSPGQALYRHPHPTSNFPISSSFGYFGPPSVEKAVGENRASGNAPFYGGILEQEGGSGSKMGSLVGDGVSSIGSSKPDRSPPPPKPIEVGSHTFADSDTEMEDDITQPDNDLGMNYSTGAPKWYSNLIPGELDNKEQLAGPRASRGNHEILFPVRGFNASNSYSQGDTNSQTEPPLTEKNADRSRQESYSPDSSKEHNFLESGGTDMYDPFLDSIEPFQNSSKKFSHDQQHEPARNHSIMPRLGISSNKPPDIEENNRGNDAGGIVPETFLDNEECGENAEAEAEIEVGSVETGSPDPPDELADTNTNSGEVESGKKKSREKRKTKESRSMRLFKVVLTQFVKDLLKPSWRQGNMSKEAFKTIVKKTVDKVSGAMEGRRIPKSRDKIDRYIDSSQHKLTKLVMGYVDKYVKT